MSFSIAALLSASTSSLPTARPILPPLPVLPLPKVEKTSEPPKTVSPLVFLPYVPGSAPKVTKERKSRSWTRIPKLDNTKTLPHKLALTEFPKDPTLQPWRNPLLTPEQRFNTFRTWLNDYKVNGKSGVTCPHCSFHHTIKDALIRHFNAAHSLGIKD